MRWDLGDRSGASEAMERAARTPEGIPEAAPYAALLRGDARAAARQLADAVAARPPAPNEPWWDGLARAELSLGLGRARRALGDLRGAREALEHAIARLEPIVRAHPAARYERRLGRARAELAFTLSSMGERASERSSAATAAAAWLRRAGGAPAELAHLEGLRIP
jgi:tetratricopeptide (TPR) repeat protein